MKGKQARWEDYFIWEERGSTTAEDHTGFFRIVGAHDVIVRLRATRQPVTGGMVVAASAAELDKKVSNMLQRFLVRWLAQTPDERKANLRQAALTAEHSGWEG